jgi:hypothetical protein
MVAGARPMTSLSRAEAEVIARRRLSEMGTGDDDYVLLPERTMEEPFGWVFFYDSRRHVRTGADADRLAGNAPMLVLRTTGELKILGTAHPIEHYLVEYRRVAGSP